MIAHLTANSDVSAPVGNTGLFQSRVAPTGTFAHLDTLVLCGDGVALFKIFDTIDRCLNCQFDTTRDYAASHGQGYQHNLHGQLGLLLSYNCSPYDDTVQYRLSVSGQVCNATSIGCMEALCRQFSMWGCHATRFDWAIDDYDRKLSIDDWIELARLECYYGARKHDEYKSIKKGGIDCGSTIYIGRAGGTQRLCIYDKNIESGGAINAIRMEYRFYDEKANYFFNCFLANGAKDSIAQKISGACLGRIGACESKLVTGKALALLRIWHQLSTSIAEKIKTTFPKKPTTIENKKEWISKSVAPTLAMLLTSMGYRKFLKWLLNLVSGATKKLKTAQIINLKYLRQWEDFIKFGIDYSLLKEDYLPKELSRNRILKQHLPPTIRSQPPLKEGKLQSEARQLTLMEELSFLIPL